MDQALRQPDIADMFERLLVPAVFERYARDLIERARPFGPSDRVLDLGCGTGIVGRTLRARLGGAARIAGLDVSPLMVAKARSLAPEIEWHEGTAVRLPFPDGAFDIVLSQQMLQFVPDRKLAVREIRRVLAPGGRVVASTWRPRAHQPLMEMVGQVSEQHFGPANDKRWSLDGDALATLLAEAGFVDIKIQLASLVEHHREFPVRLSVMAAGHDLSALSEAERERRFRLVEAETAAGFARFAVGDGFEQASVTNVATARVS